MKELLNITVNPDIKDRGIIDIYQPEGEGPFPCVIGIHGGGWKNGDRTSYVHFCPKITGHGYAFLLCSYRVEDEAKFPAAYEDLICLLKWVKIHGREYDLDNERVALLGGSAGGHLVSLLATRGTQEYTDIVDLKAVVSYCGVMDMCLQYETDKARGAAIAENFLGATPEDDPEAYKAASPICHIHSKVPPLWMAHGTEDNVVDVDNSIRIHEELKKAGCETFLHLADGLPHTMTPPEDTTTNEKSFLFEKEMFNFLFTQLQ